MVPKDIQKKEAYYHTLLTIDNILKPDTKKKNNTLKELLKEGKSLEEIYHDTCKNKEYKIDLIALQQRIASYEFELIKYTDEKYPEQLKNIPGIPPVLYTRGDTTLFNAQKSIAIVGTRNPTPYGIDQGNKVTTIMANRGYVIVSGLAKGCDTIAHTATINAKGKTIAVLGTPLNKYSIKINKKLQDFIGKEHLLVSSFPFETEIYRSYFAYRNIITAGIAINGLIVIEAGEKSGTLHAIKAAHAQQKKLYALAHNTASWTEKYPIFWVNKK